MSEESKEKEEKYYPGLEGVIAGETSISSVLGGLQYRGYAIEDLAENTSFEEVAYLVLHGDLPNRSQLSEFKNRVADSRPVPKPVIDSLRLIPKDAPAMDVLRTTVSMLAHFDSEANVSGHEANLRKAERLLAQIPTLIAARNRLKHGHEPIAPKRELGHSANLLYMISGKEAPAEHARALDVSLILYTEHEFNASTFACRVTASTLSDMYSAATSGVGTLKGPLHGGANEEAIKVLMEVGGPSNAETWGRRMFAEKKLIMGFGHRVYKKVDPRAVIIDRYCKSIAKARGDMSLEETADIIEHLVKTEKGLPANVDWPVARLYYYLGLEIELYTPLFVVARIAGWAAHIVEQQDKNRIFRPMGRYIGATGRKVPRG
jgi:2-methylcitrate synthase/citrate synthase II